MSTDNFSAIQNFSKEIKAMKGNEAEEHVDRVNSPPHYKDRVPGIEAIEVTQHFNFCLGNAIKYIWRADLKGGDEDLEKAVWYLQRELKERKSNR